MTTWHGPFALCLEFFSGATESPQGCLEIAELPHLRLLHRDPWHLRQQQYLLFLAIQQASAPASADAHMEGQVQTQGTNSMPHSKESLPSAEAAAPVEAQVEQQGLKAEELSGEVEAKETKTSLVSTKEAECKEPLPSGVDNTLGLTLQAQLEEHVLAGEVVPREM